MATATNPFACPNGHLGRIDDEQAAGEVSIICPVCDFHGDVDDGILLFPMNDE